MCGALYGMCGALYGACMVYKEQKTTFWINFSAMYGACMVHVWCIYGAFMTTPYGKKN